MLGTYAIGLIIREIVRGLLGGHYKSIPEPITGAFTLFGIDFSSGAAVIVVTTLVVIAGTWLFLPRTSIGLQVRGSLENPDAGARLRHLDRPALRPDLRLRRRARRASPAR